MEDNQDFTKVMKQYQAMLKLFKMHFKKCKTFQKEVMESGEFES